MELKTPLYEKHVASGGKMVSFAGYLLPIQYQTGLVTEHLAVRAKAGLFDVSHMGELRITGKEALANLNRLFSNDFSTMADGQARYTVLCHDDGGVVDDMVVYRFSADDYLVVVNAANRHKDVDFIAPRLAGAVAMADVSDDYAQIALQGPRSRDILARLAEPAAIPAKYYRFVPAAQVAGVPCVVSRTGYTGELGYEFYCPAAAAGALWDALAKAGQDDGLVPCGLGARDTLRLEAAMPLYGHEMDDSVSPLETGLGFAVKLDKPDFVGKAGLVRRGPPKIARVGLKAVGPGVVREGCAVYADGGLIGRTTSGTLLPYVRAACAMALVDVAYAAVGTAVEADVRGRRVACQVVPLPFYKAS
ncbi:MAG: glycine cleavage system aminomethyltransferase GcvT [Propionibacteriaceae bacterium]|nr:glycine cleavage system aminomethyltransferase GcvT [Propionibacteriaceae bacterium]